jgi:hypothetical protein
MRTTKLSFLLLFLVIDGCSAAAEPDPAPAIAPAPPAGEAPAEVPPPTCHTRANTGPLHRELRLAEERPSFTGGIIADGFYERTSSLVYTGVGGESGPMGKQRRQTIAVGGGRADVVYEDEGVTPDRGTFTLTSFGNAIEFRRTCPTDGDVAGTVRYTATPDELRIESGANGVNVYQRRP